MIEMLEMFNFKTNKKEDKKMFGSKKIDLELHPVIYFKLVSFLVNAIAEEYDTIKYYYSESKYDSDYFHRASKEFLSEAVKDYQNLCSLLLAIDCDALIPNLGEELTTFINSEGISI